MSNLSRSSSLASLADPSASAPVSASQADASAAILAKLDLIGSSVQSLTDRVDRIEGDKKSPLRARSLAEAVATVASYRDGKVGGASSRPTTAASLKEQLRGRTRRNVTPHPPLRTSVMFGPGDVDPETSLASRSRAS